MKTNYLLIIPAIMMLLFSCGKEDLESPVTGEEQTEFKYSKNLTISDESGNSADVVVHANSMQAIDAHSAEVLILNVTDKVFEIDSNSNEEITDRPEDVEDEVLSNLVYVEVVRMNFNDGVTGFNVRSEFEFDADQRATDYQYIWGSSGVNGVDTEYEEDTCTAEYLKAKLSVKTGSWDPFWGSIGSGTLYYEGAEWSTYNSSSYYRYRLKMSTHNGCAGTAYYSYNWIY